MFQRAANKDLKYFPRLGKLPIEQKRVFLRLNTKNFRKKQIAWNYGKNEEPQIRKAVVGQKQFSFETQHQKCIEKARKLLETGFVLFGHQFSLLRVSRSRADG